jgi:hypothetical protein
MPARRRIAREDFAFDVDQIEQPAGGLMLVGLAFQRSRFQPARSVISRPR